MNAQTPIVAAKPVEQHKRAADSLRDAAIRYADQVQASDGRFTETTEYARWQLCNAIIDLVDDGDALTERDNIADNLRIDEEGNPLRGDELLPLPKLLKLTKGHKQFSRSD